VRDTLNANSFCILYTHVNVQFREIDFRDKRKGSLAKVSVMRDRSIICRRGMSFERELESLSCFKTCKSHPNAKNRCGNEWDAQHQIIEIWDRL